MMVFAGRLSQVGRYLLCTVCSRAPPSGGRRRGGAEARQLLSKKCGPNLAPRGAKIRKIPEGGTAQALIVLPTLRLRFD